MPSELSKLCSVCSDIRCVTKQGRNIRINSIVIFTEYLNSLNNRIPESKKVTAIIDELAKVAINASITKYGKNPTKDSLKNCRGRWLELVFSTAVTTLSDELWKSRVIIFPLPVARLGATEWWQLLNERERTMIMQLQVHSSNPDMIVIKVPQGLEQKIVRTKDPVELWSGATWKQLKGRISIRDVISFGSLKTSLRPDRRYLSLFEAITLKAIASFFRTKIKYFVICPRFSSADRKILKGKTLHDRFSSEAVDYLFSFRTMKDLYNIVRIIAV